MNTEYLKEAKTYVPEVAAKQGKVTIPEDLKVVIEEKVDEFIKTIKFPVGREDMPSFLKVAMLEGATLATEAIEKHTRKKLTITPEGRVS